MSDVIMPTLAQAYVAGWRACLAGDIFFTNPYVDGTRLATAWNHGFIDAAESEGEETPCPECAGYTVRI